MLPVREDSVSEAPEQQPGEETAHPAKTFGYDLLVLAAGAVLPAGGIGALLFGMTHASSPMTPSRLLVGILFAVLVLGSAWAFWSSPMTIRFENRTVEARWLFGRARRWPVRSLRRKDSANILTSGSTEILDESGGLAFRIFPNLLGKEELLREIDEDP